MGVGTFLFGEDPADVKLTDPHLMQATATRDLLRKRYEEQLAGGRTEGEAAIMQAARTGAEQLGESARGRAAGTRGFARLAALSSANRAANVGQQRILGQAATAAGAQRAQDIESAEQSMLSMDQQAIQQMMIEEELKKARAKPGALGIIGALTGAGIGAFTGDPIGGAKLGGSIGSGVGQFGQAWT